MIQVSPQRLTPGDFSPAVSAGHSGARSGCPRLQLFVSEERLAGGLHPPQAYGRYSQLDDSDGFAISESQTPTGGPSQVRR